jgi:hypothetical protein
MSILGKTCMTLAGEPCPSQSTLSKPFALPAAGSILTRKKEGQCVYYGMKNQLAVKLCELVRAQLAG